MNNKYVKEENLHYNFIAFPNKWYYPYKDIASLPEHNKKSPKEFENSGYIEYTINNINKLTTDFRKNSNGDIYISGSEIRGKIRSNLEILSFSYPEFVEDKKILYRDFTSRNSVRKNSYSKTLNLTNDEQAQKINEVVKVGYLKKEDNEYYIYPADKVGDKNFHVIDEHDLITRYNHSVLDIKERMYVWENKDLYKMGDLKRKVKDISKNIYEVKRLTGLDKNEEFNKSLKDVYLNSNLREEKNLVRKYEIIKDELKNKVFCGKLEKYYNIRELYERRTKLKLDIQELWKRLKVNKYNFIPFEKKVNYSINDKNGVKEISNQSKDHKNGILLKGVLYCSNTIKGKKNHYLIGKISSNNSIKVNDKVKKLYNDNLKKSKVRNKRLYDIFDIFNKNNGNKYEIVFYLTDEKNEIINIARTPYMKVSYKNTIKDVINKKNVAGETNTDYLSYADAIFGFAGKGRDGSKAYKSRVRFSNAIIEKGSLLEETEKLFLPQPYASAFGMYLKQSDVKLTKDIISYADDIDKIELRGHKFYKIRDKEKGLKYMDKYKDMISIKKVLEPNSIIKGRISFNNLTDAELGLLLTSIDISNLDKSQDYYELFGGAKAYGYGKSKITIDNLYLEDGHGVLDFEDLGYKEIRGYAKFIKAYQNEMKDLLKENKTTIEEYKISKKLFIDPSKENHYLDYINGEKKGISTYEENQILKPLALEGGKHQ